MGLLNHHGQDHKKTSGMIQNLLGAQSNKLKSLIILLEILIKSGSYLSIAAEWQIWG